MTKILAASVISAITLTMLAIEEPSLGWTQIVQLGSAAGAVAVAVLFLREQNATREAFLKFMTAERERQSAERKEQAEHQRAERKLHLQYIAAEFALNRAVIKDGDETTEESSRERAK